MAATHTPTAPLRQYAVLLVPRTGSVGPELNRALATRGIDPTEQHDDEERRLAQLRTQLLSVGIVVGLGQTAAAFHNLNHYGER